MKSLQESLFDVDLVEKDLPSFKDIFKIDSTLLTTNSQFNLRKLKKDIKASGKDESEIIINCIAEIIGNIKIYQMVEKDPESVISEVISPYILSRLKPVKNIDVCVWDGEYISSTRSSKQFLNWNVVQIDILALSIRFKHK